MTDEPPRRRIITGNRVMWALMILCAVGAAWVYEAGAFERAGRAQQYRLVGYSTPVYRWPEDAYRGILEKPRDPRAAEAAMSDADSVSYFLHQRPQGPVLGQVFHLTLRHGFRRWRRQITMIYDEYPAPDRLEATPPGPPLSRQAALAWYDDWQRRQREWRSENAHRLLALKVNLLLVGGTYDDISDWWHLEPESPGEYDAILTSIYRFGDAGVEMLVDCLDDAGPTTTRRLLEDGPGAPVPAGTLCYHILKGLVTFEDNVPESETVVVDGEPSSEWLGDLAEPADAARLAAGEAAWRARMKRGNFQYVRPNGI